MMLSKVMPDRLILCFRFYLLQLPGVLALRLLFFILYGDSSGNYTSADLLKSLHLGLKFDNRLCVVLTALPFLLAAIPGVAIFKNRRKTVTTFWPIFLTLIHAAILIIYAIDLASYGYLQTRVNVNLLRFLDAPEISLAMAWESYPIIWVAISIVIFCSAYFFLLKKWVFSHRRNSPVFTNNLSWKVFVPVWSLSFILLLGGIYGKFAWYPLRWSEAFFSRNKFISAFALNPVIYLYDTLKFKETKDDYAAKLNKYKKSVQQYLGLDGENFVRVVPPKSKRENPNIVVIVLESQAAYKSGLFGSTIDPTPHLDQMAGEGILFKNFFVPTQATARSMFTLVTGLPDLSQVETVSRNPFMINQHTIINSYKEHEKFFFIGGSANWGNIRGIFSYNIDGLKIYEEKDFSAPHVDVWGISDYRLLIEVNQILKKRTGPFLAIIQTAGFHRPYTIPKDRGDFKIKSLKDKTLYAKNGFISEDEYNSIRWQDYALGNFIKLAKKEKYFANTLFVIYGDHGLPVLNAEHVPPGERIHDFENFHVPLVFYWPKKIRPKVENKYTSQLDLWPTITSMLGRGHVNTTLGRDIWHPRFRDKNEAFIYYWYTSPPQFGIIRDNFFYKDDLSVSQLYNYSSKAPDQHIGDRHPSLYLELKNLARGIYYASKYLAKNNPKRDDD